MVIAMQTLLGTGATTLVLLALTFCMWRYQLQAWFQRIFAFSGGFVLGALLLFVLPSIYAVNIQSAFFVVLGVLAVPVLHLLLVERQSDTKKVRHPLSGLLSWARVAILALLYGDATALIGLHTFDIVLFSIITVLALAPEFYQVYTLLHYEGARKTRAALLTGALAFLPFVAAIAVGTLVLAVLPELAAPFIGVAAGTMLYMSVADQIGESLRRRSWLEIALTLLGGGIAALIVVLL